MWKKIRNSNFIFLHCLESSVFSLRHFLKMFVTFFSCLLKLFKEPFGYTWSKQTVLQGLSQAIHHPQNQPNLWQNHPHSCVFSLMLLVTNHFTSGIRSSCVHFSVFTCKTWLSISVPLTSWLSSHCVDWILLCKVIRI